MMYGVCFARDRYLKKLILDSFKNVFDNAMRKREIQRRYVIGITLLYRVTL